MVGWLEASGQTKHIRQDITSAAGLTLLRISTPLTRRRVRRAARLFLRKGVTRVLTPPAFPYWPELLRAGLHPVDPLPLCRVLAPQMAFRLLDAIPPRDRVVMLRGGEHIGSARFLAEQLCPGVGTLILDLGPYEEPLADHLRSRWGAAVLPSRAGRPPQLIIELSRPRSPCSAPYTLKLWGTPDLAGLCPAAPSADLPSSLDPLPLLALLRETDHLQLSDLILRSEEVVNS